METCHSPLLGRSLIGNPASKIDNPRGRNRVSRPGSPLQRCVLVGC